VFHVSDSQDLAKENFKPRYVEGEMLGSEWDEAIARYWRERDHVREMKRVNEFCVGLGFGALEWLERQEGEVRGVDTEDEEDTEGEEDEEDDDEMVGTLKKSPRGRRRSSSGGSRRNSGGTRRDSGGRRRDSGGSKNVRFEGAESEEEPVSILEKSPGEPGGSPWKQRRDSGGSRNVRFFEGCKEG
jgi:hypothetical protein